MNVLGGGTSPFRKKNHRSQDALGVSIFTEAKSVENR